MSARRTRPALPTVVTVLVLPLALVGCSGGEDGVDEALRSSGTTPFSVVERDGAEHVVGHGITMQIPAGWTDYGSEQDSADGTSYEWAVGLPADTRPLPSGVQFSMGRKGRGAAFETLPETTRELAERAPGYTLLDEGEVDIPGAEAAAFLRLEKDVQVDGDTVRAEQLQLMLDMPGGQTSVVRFIAEAGRWKAQMQHAYESLVVAEEDAEA
jgi:hypothetical protein